MPLSPPFATLIAGCHAIKEPFRAGTQGMAPKNEPHLLLVCVEAETFQLSLHMPIGGLKRRDHTPKEACPADWFEDDLGSPRRPAKSVRSSVRQREDIR